MNRIRALIGRWLAFPRMIVVAIIAAGVLGAPALSADFFLDDCALIDKMEAQDAHLGQQLDLYRFLPGSPSSIAARMHRGTFGWWTSPNLKVAFFRPLASALLQFDFFHFRRDPRLYHVHSYLWYLALVGVVGLLLWHMLPTPVGATALMLFACTDCHWMTIGWPANRHTSVATLFALLSLGSYLSYRTMISRHIYVSLFALALALLASESALCVVAYLLAYELVGARDSWRRRFIAILPVGILCTIYLAAYCLLGYGTRTNGEYFDPRSHPTEFIRVLILHIPQLLGGYLSGQLPLADSAGSFSAAPWIVIGAIFTVGVAALSLTQRRRIVEGKTNHVVWLSFGSIVALVPVAATRPSSRLVLASSFGLSVVLASALVTCAEAIRDAKQSAAKRSAWAVGLMTLILFYGVRPAASLPYYLNHLTTASRELQTAAQTAEVPMQGGKQVIALNAPDAGVHFHTAFHWLQQREHRVESWWTLSLANSDHRMTRTGDATLELEFLDHPLRGRDLPFRDSGALFYVGDEVDVGGMRVHILTVRGGAPSRLRFQFERSLDDNRYCFVTWQRNRFQRFVMIPIGENVILRRVQPLFGPIDG